MKQLPHKGNQTQTISPVFMSHWLIPSYWHTSLWSRCKASSQQVTLECNRNTDLQASGKMLPGPQMKAAQRPTAPETPWNTFPAQRGMPISQVACSMPQTSWSLWCTWDLNFKIRTHVIFKLIIVLLPYWQINYTNNCENCAKLRENALNFDQKCTCSISFYLQKEMKVSEIEEFSWLCVVILLFNSPQ